MRKIILGIVLLSISLFGELHQVLATEDFLKKDIPIIDIRTPEEWRQTGIVKGAHTIMFFNERGGYDMDGFLNKLNQVIKKDQTFALICRTGSRTSMISGFLDKELGYKVINLQGGMVELMRQGYKPTPYTTR